MNGGARAYKFGAAIKKVSKKGRGRGKALEGLAVCLRMIFTPYCKRLKVKENVSGHIGAKARLTNVG